MSDFKQLFKSKLKYHRLVAVGIVLTYIFIKYNFDEKRPSYENGQIKYEGEYLNGMNEGLWIWYYENGNKQMQGLFKEGRRTGTWKMWSLNGTLVNEAKYEIDKLNGPYTEWYSNGKKQSEGFFSNDKLDGAVKRFDTSENLIDTKYYTNGVLTK